MPGIELSAQPMKTSISRGNHGQIFIITTRAVPEHPDDSRNTICCSTIIKVGDPVRLLPGKAGDEVGASAFTVQTGKRKQSESNS